MSSARRSLLAMLATPALAAAVFTAPVADAWQVGSDSHYYEYTDFREKTTIGTSVKTVSGSDWITSEASNCARHDFFYKRYNTLSPTTVLISQGLTTGDLCGPRAREKDLGNQGEVTIFGNFKASRAVNPVRNWIQG